MALRRQWWTYAVSFKGRRETFEQVFGTGPLNTAQMNKLLWNFIRKHKLIRKRYKCHQRKNTSSS